MSWDPGRVSFGESKDGYTDEELAFLAAMDRYIRETGRKFPAFTEVLAVAKSLGYRRAADEDARTDRPAARG